MPYTVFDVRVPAGYYGYVYFVSADVYSEANEIQVAFHD